MDCESPALYQHHLGQTTEPRGLSASSSLTTETPFLRYFGFVPIWFLLLDFSLFFSLFLFFRLFAVQFCFLTVCPPVFQVLGLRRVCHKRRKQWTRAVFLLPCLAFLFFFGTKSVESSFKTHSRLLSFFEETGHLCMENRFEIPRDSLEKTFSGVLLQYPW